MPAHGKKDQMSEAELAQRHEASRKHGVYAIQQHGETAMTEDQRSVRNELLDQVKTKEGAIDVLREMAIDALLLSKVAQDAVIQEHDKGKPLGEIPLVARLPQFQNSAARILTAYISTFKDDDKNAITADMVLKEILKGQHDETE